MPLENPFLFGGKMLNLYIVRHGQTEWNVERRFQGWLNSPLTEQGVQSAKELAPILKKINLHRKYVSPSDRAVQTMTYALEGDTHDVVLDERIREIGLGPWQGLKHEQVEALYPEQVEAFYNQPESFELQDAETYYDIENRVKAFLKDLVEDYMHQEMVDDYNVLIVTHGVTLMMFQLIFDQMPISEISRYSVSKNTQLHHYVYEEGVYTKCI